jgi:hypothetical protein
MVTDKFKNKQIRKPKLSSVSIKLNNGLLELDISKLDFDIDEIKNVLKNYNVKKKYYKLINRTGLYKKAYKDIVGGTSVPEKYLDKGTTIEWISDDNFGWSKIKYRGTSYYIFNSHIPDEKLSPCKSGVVLNTDTFGYRVYKDGHKGSRKQFRKGQKFTAICVIEEGKYKDWTYVRINNKKYYLKAKLL